MESDPAIVLLGAVVVLLVAILIGIVIAARGPFELQSGEDWEREMDEVYKSLEQLSRERERMKEELESLLDELAGIAQLLERGERRPGTRPE